MSISIGWSCSHVGCRREIKNPNLECSTPVTQSPTRMNSSEKTRARCGCISGAPRVPGPSDPASAGHALDLAQDLDSSPIPHRFEGIGPGVKSVFGAVEQWVTVRGLPRKKTVMTHMLAPMQQQVCSPVSSEHVLAHPLDCGLASNALTRLKTTFRLATEPSTRFRSPHTRGGWASGATQRARALGARALGARAL